MQLIARPRPSFFQLHIVSTTFGTTHRVNLGLAIDTHFVFFSASVQPIMGAIGEASANCGHGLTVKISA
jgi:hypothetical protein